MAKKYIRTLSAEFNDDTGEFVGFVNLKKFSSGLSAFMLADLFSDLERAVGEQSSKYFNKVYSQLEAQYEKDKKKRTKELKSANT